MNTHVSQSVHSQSVVSNQPSSITPEEVAKAIHDLDVLASTLGAHAVPLSIEGRRAVLKMRAGGAAQVPVVLGLAERYGLSIPGVDSAEALADLELAAKLRPLSERLKAMSQLVDDTILQAQARSWQATTTTYTMLVRLVGRFPTLQTELDPMASLLSLLHKGAPKPLRKKVRGPKVAKKRAKPEPTAVTPPPTQAAPPTTAQPVASS